jgi:hypothetical protein
MNDLLKRDMAAICHAALTIRIYAAEEIDPGLEFRPVDPWPFAGIDCRSWRAEL